MTNLNSIINERASCKKPQGNEKNARLMNQGECPGKGILQ